MLFVAVSSVDVAPGTTVTVSLVDDMTRTPPAWTEPKCTIVEESKLVPVTVMVLPPTTGPPAGANRATDGTAVATGTPVAVHVPLSPHSPRPTPAAVGSDVVVTGTVVVVVV